MDSRSKGIRKDQRRIHFPLTLSLEGGDEEAVCNHHGGVFGGGHYIAFVCVGGGDQWVSILMIPCRPLCEKKISSSSFLRPMYI
jgi:hypothetical protein